VIVVLAEKPSVARDLAAVLGAHVRREGYFEGAGYRVTWAIGHLVGLAEPHEIQASWRTWSRASLPMLPQTFPLVVLDHGRAQYRIVERLLRARDTASVVAATDAGREGELIFRYIYERSGCTKPWQRLWVSALTEPAIRAAFAKLQPGRTYDGLADAAKARSRADWLVGMNLSRAYTLAQGTLCSVGRVQTPTLAMVVARDRQIRDFVPEHYCEVEAEFEAKAGRYRGTYHRIALEGVRSARGTLRSISAELARLPIAGEEAEAIAQRAREGRAQVVAVERQTRRTPAPLLYDLTELQRHANRLFGFTAKRTLDVAQTLYEKHKLLSYPRTDSRHLSEETAAQLPEIVRAIAPRYPGLIAAGSQERQLSRRFIDASKVRDHHALIPTALTARLPAGSDEARIYDLVCRRLLMAWHPDLVEALATVITAIEPGAAAGSPDMFVSRGTSREAAGWTVLELRSARPQPTAAEPSIPAGLKQEDAVVVVGARLERRHTQPPRAFTEGTLLTAMEAAGRSLSDRALIDAMRDSGLGTPATRAATLETLLARTYLTRTGKNIESTAAGEALIDAVHERVKSPAMTGSWELRLHRMERGEEGFDAFMREIEAYVGDVVNAVGALPAKARVRSAKRGAASGASGVRRGMRREANGGAKRGKRPAKRRAAAAPLATTSQKRSAAVRRRKRSGPERTPASLPLRAAPTPTSNPRTRATATRSDHAPLRATDAEPGGRQPRAAATGVEAPPPQAAEAAPSTSPLRAARSRTVASRPKAALSHPGSPAPTNPRPPRSAQRAPSVEAGALPLRAADSSPASRALGAAGLPPTAAGAERPSLTAAGTDRVPPTAAGAERTDRLPPTAAGAEQMASVKLAALPRKRAPREAPVRARGLAEAENDTPHFPPNRREAAEPTRNPAALAPATDRTPARRTLPIQTSVDALRRWRVVTANQQRIAAFLLLGDRQLFELARAQPTSRSELQRVGLSTAWIAKHGDEVLAILHRDSGPSGDSR
jgi:DNA topoisomerase III